KWSKTAYRTGTDFTIAKPFGSTWTIDSALTLRLPDGRAFGRHSTVTVEMESNHIRYLWNLGVKHGQVNCTVDTTVWWRAGWLLQVHALENRQPATLRLGGYSLDARDPHSPRIDESSPHAIASRDNARGTVLQPLLGFSTGGWEKRLDDTSPRTHLRAPYHLTPYTATATFGAPAGEDHIL